MQVFLLYAHDFRYLPYQVKAIRCYLPEVTEITVVQGPFRGLLFDSKTQLAAAAAKELDIALWTLSDSHWAGAFARLTGIYEQCMGRGPGLKLMMHSDCIPDRPMTAAQLLNDRLSAGRGYSTDKGPYQEWTWLLTDAKKITEIVDDVQLWPSRIDNAELHTEYCEPGFLHMDKISFNYLTDEKLTLLEQRFGKLNAPQTEPAEIRPKDCVDAAPLPPATPEESTEASRREGICRACPRWDPIKEGCGLLRKCERHTLTQVMWRREKSACRLGRWLRPEVNAPALLLGPKQIYIPDLPTIVYTIVPNEKRQHRVKDILDDFQFANWEFFNGSTGGAYWTHIYQDHAKLLREREPPLLILEDDIEPRAFTPIIEPPPGAEIVYLGGGRGGSRIGVKRAIQSNGDFQTAYRYAYRPIDADWMCIAGMWFTHAILWLDKRVMLEAADALMSVHRAIDTTLAQHQWRWNVVCRRVPMFWQNDGHHKRDTFDYLPPGVSRETNLNLRAMRHQRQRLLRKL